MKRAKQGSGRSPKHLGLATGNARNKAHLPKPLFRWYWLGILTAIFLLLFFQCGRKVKEFTTLADLEGGRLFAVPTGTVADQFVLQRFPDARLIYFNSVYDCALAVQQGKADAAVYDMPVLKNIAGKNPGLMVIDEVMVPDNYGFAVELDNTELKGAIDATLSEMRSTGLYDEMLKRWLPDQGLPGPMPDFENNKAEEKLLFATAAVTEPMSYIDSNHQIIGFDIEFAQRIANRLNRRLEILNMEFGAMLPALISGKVDMIGAGLSITEERAKSVLFSESYYKGGLVALVRQPANPEPAA
ncbi:MAG: transporter substrate-binding domain-containing protein, partial [Bacteroidales bacterium]